jgi:hypothetical protein
MHRSKKYLRKSGVDHEQLKDSVFEQNQQAARAEEVETLKDSALFTVNKGADRLQQKRAALAADRFKAKTENGHLKSKTELALLKRLMNKGPSVPQKKEEVDEFANLWETPLNEPKARTNFREFTNKATTKVKAVIFPLSGQSVNPSASAH